MKRKAGSTRTVLLAAMVVALLAANVWWFFLRAPAPQQLDFELGGWDGLTVGIDAPTAASAPLFDPVHDRWTRGGHAVNDLRPLVRSTQEQTDAASTVNYVAVRLADDAGSDQMRRALLTLVRQRICFVALVDASAGMAPVHRIVSVRDGQGQVHSCKS